MSRYDVYVTPRAWREIRELPGNVRQRVKKAIDGLADDPRPTKSKQLDTPDRTPHVYRLRLEKWRIVYAVTEEEHILDVLTVRKRPPYDYGNLRELMRESR